MSAASLQQVGKKKFAYSWEAFTILVVGEHEALEREPEFGCVLTLDLFLDPPLQLSVAWDFIAGKVGQTEAASLIGVPMRAVCLHGDFERRGGRILGEVEEDFFWDCQCESAGRCTSSLPRQHLRTRCL